MGKKIVIIGGVAGGASVAARARRIDESAQIIMFERGPHVSFSNCCLPYFFNRAIATSDELVLMSPDQFKNQYNIIAKTSHEVVKIDKEGKKVRVKNLESGEEFDESYDTLVLSPGASPILPRSIKGIENKNVFTLRNVVDVRKIDDYIHKENAEEIAVIGGGFIGIEVAESLVEAGKKVTLIEKLDQIMSPLDYDMAQILHKEMYDKGVNLILGDGLKEIRENSVVTESGKEFNADVVVMSLGVRPETKLAVEAEIAIGETGGILVDHNYKTSDDDIYAVGDAVEVSCFFTTKKRLLALAGPAQRQARAAADHMYGKTHRNIGVIGSSAVRVFDMNVASTGLNEKACKNENIAYDFAYVIPSDIVGLMPGSAPLFFKLIFAKPSGKILGAQAVGRGDAAKRVDVIATMITMGGTLEDLKELELCYSPVYSTAKDVVNHAALVGYNILNKEFEQVSVSMVRELVEKGETIIDVREKHEFELGHIKNAINIPLSQLRDRLDEIPNDGRNIYLHCRSSQRSYNALRALRAHGIKNVFNISGSYLGLSYFEYFNDVTKGRDRILTEYNFN